MLPGLPRRRRALPAPLPPRARRRVPGHQPRAVPAGQASWSARSRAPRVPTPCRRPSCASSATPTSRSTPSAARRSATSSSSSRTTPTPARSCSSRTTARRRRILRAANSVIARNEGRRAKNLWTDSGDGALIIGYVADNEHDEAAFVAKEIDDLADDSGVKPGRRRRLLPHQRPDPCHRGGAHAGRPALQGGRRHALLRAPRGQGRAGLPAGRSPTPTDTVNLRRILNMPKRGIGDRAEACVGGPRRARAHPVRRGARPGRGRAGHRHALGRRHQGLHRPARESSAVATRPTTASRPCSR